MWGCTQLALLTAILEEVFLRVTDLTETTSKLSGLASCDAGATRIRIRIVRRERPAKRQKHKPCETQARYIFPFLPVGSQKSGFKVPKRGQFHAAILVTPKRCDSCAQGPLGRRTVLRRNFCDAEHATKHLRQ